MLLHALCNFVFLMCLQNAVIQSRQFPFRFLAAYKVIMELHTLGEIQTHQVALILLTESWSENF